MATFFVTTTQKMNAVTIDRMALPATWEYTGQDSDGWDTYHVEIEAGLVPQLDRALRSSDKVIAYRQIDPNGQ